MLKGGAKPNLPMLTIAQQIASIVLAIWRSGEPYDTRQSSGAPRRWTP